LRPKAGKIKLNLSDPVINLITGPALLALPIALILILVLQFDFPVYKASISEFYKRTDEIKRTSYADINSDGINERIETFNYKTNAAAIVYTLSGNLYESYNLKGYWYSNPEYQLADIDRNSISEMYSITITSDDSVFVNQTEFNQRSNDKRSKFVSSISRHNGERDCVIESLGFSDINGDRIPEYIFSISAGFTLQPRAVYAWDLAKDSLYRSPFAGVSIKYNHSIPTYDLDNDGIQELFLHTTSTDNYHSQVAFSDTGSYAFILTKDLNFFIDPVLMAGPSSHTSTYPWITKEDTLILSLAWDRRLNVNFLNTILLDPDGTILDTSSIQANSYTYSFFINDKIHLMYNEDRKNHAGFISEELDFEEKRESDLKLGGSRYLNLDQDPALEIISVDPDKGLFVIFEENFKNVTTCEFPHQILSFKDVSLVSTDGSGARIHIQSDQYSYYIEYIKSKFTYLRFPFYFALYGAIYLVLYFLQRIFLFRNRRRKLTEERMLNLQLQSAMNQLNPHFTFNALNTIGDSVLEGRSEEAYEYFTKLAALIRISMTNAFQLDKTLEEELSFVHQYLEIEKLRFKEKLQFTIELDPSINKALKIPKMLLHIFVENAMKHGIFHKDEGGNIEIKLKKEKRWISIEIIDDGIGREAAGSLGTMKGKGLQILDNYLRLYRKSHGAEISYTMEDRNPGAKYPGTLVCIKIYDS